MDRGNGKLGWKMSCGGPRGSAAQGFTLLELLIVVVIVGVLAMQVVTGWNSPEPKLKNAAFNMRGDFNLARAEAVKRKEDVRVTFLFDAADQDGDGVNEDGYRLWIDDDPAAGDGNYTDGSDTLIKEVYLRDEVQFYAQDVPAPDGPGKDVGGDAWATSSATVDGVSFNNNWFSMRDDGTSNIAGTVYLYAPDREVLAATPNDPAVIDAGPLAVVTSTIGRVRLLRWRSDMDLPNGQWNRK